jgi:hydroxymethylglutaryl-CoA lyase
MITSKLRHLVSLPIFFDVSLRDGLQTMKRIMPFGEKVKMLHQIINKHNPKSIEIGSVVSPKVLPQLADSLDLFKYTQTLSRETDYFMLVPNMKGLKIALDNGVENFSLITSVSEKFQQKNIKKSLLETKEEICEMVQHIKHSNSESQIKLYISCINECPIAGKQSNSHVVKEIQSYIDLEIDEFCISDTYGTLHHEDCAKIIDNLGFNISKLSMHLHHSGDENLQKILEYCLGKGIVKYDVSILRESGGCSVTMGDKKNINGNLHYDDFSRIIDKI